jgi:site-specific DNA-cytosine methylase
MGTGGGQVPLVGISDGDKTYSFHIKQDPISEKDTSICITEQMGVGVAIPSEYTPELVLRRLTPLECERLMGFPDNHTEFDSNGKKIADTNRYKMCGNAVASPVAEWIGRHLIGY